MTIAFRSQVHAFYAQWTPLTNTIVLSKPAGLASGDIAIVIIVAGSGNSISDLSGLFTQLDQQVQPKGTVAASDAQFVTAVFSRVCDGTEPASFTFQTDIPTTLMQGSIACWSGANTINPIDLNTGIVINSYSAKQWTSPGGSVGGSEEMLLRIGACYRRGSPLISSIGTIPGCTARSGAVNGYLLVNQDGRSLGCTIQERFEAAPTTEAAKLFAASQPIGGGVGITIALIPTNRAPSVTIGTTPRNGQTMNLAGTPTFAWTSSDPDVGDSQSAWAMRRKIGAGAYEYYNVGTGLWQSTEVFNTDTKQYIQFASGKWANATTYLWSVSVKDQSGAVSGYPADLTITGGTVPTFSVTLPEAVSQGSLAPIVAWTSITAPSMAQVKVFTDVQKTDPSFNADITTPIYDSGRKPWLTTSHQVRIPLDEGVSYWMYVRLEDTSHAVTDWTIKQFVINNDPAMYPTLTATSTTGTTGPRADLVATSQVNLLTFDESALGNSAQGWVALSNCTIARSTTFAQSGDASLALTASSAATMTATTAEGLTGKPCVVGIAYEAAAWFRPTVNRTVRVGIRWYNASGVLLSTSFSSATAVTTGGWTSVVSGSQVAPANAAYMAVVVEIQVPANAEVHYVDQIFLGAPGSVAAAWTRGGAYYGNLLNQYSSTFEGSQVDHNWQNWFRGVAEGTMTKTNSTGQAKFGIQSLKATCTLTGDAHLELGYQGYEVGPSTVGIPIKAGSKYTFSAWLRSSAATQKCYATIEWLDSSSNVVQTVDGLQITITNAAFSQIWVMAKAPAGATQARLRVTILSINATEYIYLDAVNFTLGYTLMSDLGPTMPLFFDIEYSDDSVHWLPVRGGYLVDPTEDIALSVSDFEISVAGARSYRARMAAEAQVEAETGQMAISVNAGTQFTVPSVPLRGDFDIRALIEPNIYIGPKTIAAKQSAATAAGTVFLFQFDGSGSLTIAYSDGTTLVTRTSSTGITNATAGRRRWVRATVQLNDGSNNNVVKFWQSEDGATWTQIGTTVTTAGAPNALNQTAQQVEIGTKQNGATTDRFAGEIYRVQLRDGIDGAIVLDFDPSLADPNSMQFTDLYGNVFTSGQKQASWGASDSTKYSLWTDIRNVINAFGGDWWLKDLYDPTVNFKLFVESTSDGGFDASGQVAQATFDVQGRTDQVVVSDTWKSDSIAFKSLMFSSDYASYETIRKRMRPVLIQSDQGEQWYVVLDARDRHLINTNQQFQRVDIKAIQVARPAVT